MSGHSQKIRYLKEIDLFREFGEREINQLDSLTHFKDFERDELIFSAEDLQGRVYLIKHGEVRLYALNADGEQVILELLSPGTVFGDFSSLGARGFDWDSEVYAAASAPGHLCVISRDDFESLIRQNPSLAVRLLSYFARRLRHAETKIKDLVLSDAKGRVLQALRHYGQEYGEEDQNYIYLTTKLTHAEIGELAGLARETVTRSLQSLRQQGSVLSYDEGKLVVLKGGD